jgi:hypothetical protein
VDINSFSKILLDFQGENKKKEKENPPLKSTSGTLQKP